jgi:hypothetical protein
MRFVNLIMLGWILIVAHMALAAPITFVQNSLQLPKAVDSAVSFYPCLLCSYPGLSHSGCLVQSYQEGVSFKLIF